MYTYNSELVLFSELFMKRVGVGVAAVKVESGMVDVGECEVSVQLVSPSR